MELPKVYTAEFLWTGATMLPLKQDHMDLTGLYRIPHPTAEEHTVFSSTHEIFFRIDHVADLKTSLDKLKI